MSNVHQLTEFNQPPKSLTGVRAGRPINPAMSAIEYIVENAKPGEVVHVDECDYYSKYLWRSYKGFSTRYSCT